MDTNEQGIAPLKETEIKAIKFKVPILRASVKHKKQSQYT